LLAPPSVSEKQSNISRVCPVGLRDIGNYSGTKKDLNGIYDAGGSNVVASINVFELSLSTYVDQAIVGPISFSAPDEAQPNSPMTPFNYWLTNIVVVGTKNNANKLGGDTFRGRVGVGLITKADGTLYDCKLNTLDERKICELLGGTLARDPILLPRCVFNRLPVVQDWSLMPANNTPPFINGDTYVQRILFAGDAATLNTSFTNRTNSPRPVGLAVATPDKKLLAVGEGDDGSFGFTSYKNGYRTWSLFPDPNTGNGLFPNGKMALRTYGDTPFVFGTGSSTSAVISPRRKLFAVNGAMTSTDLGKARSYLNGQSSTNPLRENLGLLVIHGDDSKTFLGSAAGDSAYGVFTVSPTQPLGGIFYVDASSPYWNGSPAGGMVMKAYNGNDLIFMNKNSSPCLADCVPLLIRGDTGNANIGGGFTIRHNAKLYVNAKDSLIGNPGLKVLGQSTFDGEVRFSSIKESIFDGVMRVAGTIHNPNTARIVVGDSDERLKTDIQPITNALEKLLKINGVYYRWKNKKWGPHRQMGVIAQTVEKVFPEAVSTSPSGTKAVAYQNLVAPLIEAIKSQQKEIESLQHEHDSLAEELNQMLERLCLDAPDEELCRLTSEISKEELRTQ
jgi:hypothetical protein